MSSPLQKLDTFILPARDLDALAAWYERALGVPPRLRDEWIASFPLGDTSLTLERETEAREPARGTYPIFYAPDITEAHAFLAALGATVMETQRPSPGFAYFEGYDPEGNRFNVCSY